MGINQLFDQETENFAKRLQIMAVLKLKTLNFKKEYNIV